MTLYNPSNSAYTTGTNDNPIANNFLNLCTNFIESGDGTEDYDHRIYLTDDGTSTGTGITIPANGNIQIGWGGLTDVTYSANSITATTSGTYNIYTLNDTKNTTDTTLTGITTRFQLFLNGLKDVVGSSTSNDVETQYTNSLFKKFYSGVSENLRIYRKNENNNYNQTTTWDPSHWGNAEEMLSFNASEIPMSPPSRESITI